MFKVDQLLNTDYQKQLSEKDRARDELAFDTVSAIEYKKFVFIMDMQAVKLCPALNASALYYGMKMKVHNFTIYNLSPEHHCSNYWWDECEGELEASVFASLIIKHLNKYCTTVKKDIIMYSDG